MCFFPIQNLNTKGKAYQSGITHFNCGCCPECLSARASAWALRSVYEAREHSQNCMITLTYDNYARDARGRILGELPVNRDLHVCKRDLQLFIKRLRKAVAPLRFKYIATAEYGKRTHRAHYHVLLFGFCFPDCVLYKKSKRDNYIYKSKILTDIWGHGICTVDSINITAQTARYCTKYCAKDTRTDDTFMLFSHGVGESGLCRDFNGKSYIVEGREYPVPRFVWQRYIVSAHSVRGQLPFTYKYVNRDRSLPRLLDFRYLQNVEKRRRYREIRDGDKYYQIYLRYWKDMADRVEARRLPLLDRIRQLPDDKYASYKIAALDCLNRRHRGIPASPPRANNLRSYYMKWVCDLRIFSCHKCANDTERFKEERFCVNSRLKHPRLRFFDVENSDLEIFL